MATDSPRTAGTSLPDRGFTIIEVLLALTVMSIGAAGVFAVHSTSIHANRHAGRLGRAQMLAEQIMEDLYSKTVAAAQTEQGDQGDVTTQPEGVTYHRSYSVAAIPGQANLYLATVTVSFPEVGNEDDLHTVQLQMVRAGTGLTVDSWRQVY